VLDVVPQLPGQSAAAALRETAEVAQAADDLGYRLELPTNALFIDHV